MLYDVRENCRRFTLRSLSEDLTLVTCSPTQDVPASNTGRNVSYSGRGSFLISAEKCQNSASNSAATASFPMTAVHFK
jgi:hypothetical protein